MTIDRTPRTSRGKESRCRALAGPNRRHTPRAASEGDDDSAADDRTSPFPYAESFAEWVADETAPDER
jgi:hypothetical protein